VAQSVEHLTLDFSSGRDLWVVRWNPALGCTLSVEPTWDSLSLSLPLPLRLPPFTLNVSLKKKKL